MAGADRQVESALFRFVLNRPALTIALIVSAVMFVGILATAIATNTFATDFSVYWRTANDPVSAAYLPRAELPFPYAPTMLLWITPLAVVGMWPAFAVFITASAAALAIACRQYLGRAEIALVLLSPPVVNALHTGQVSVLLAAVMLWSVTTERRISAGVAFAIIASIKPQLVLLAPLVLLLDRDWRAFASSALCFVFLIVASIAAFGWQRWPEWAGSMSSFRSVLHAQDVLGVAVTPASVAENYGLWALPFLLLGIAAGVWLVIRCRRAEPLAKCAAVATGSLLSAPYALTYDLAPIMPFLAYLIYRGSIPAAIALSTALNPMPLLVTTYCLTRKIK